MASGVVVGQKRPDNNARPMLPLVAWEKYKDRKQEK